MALLLVTSASLAIVSAAEQPEQNSVGRSSFESRGILTTQNVGPDKAAGAAAAARATADTAKTANAHWWKDGRRDDIFNCTVPIPAPSWLVDIRSHTTARACARRCRLAYLKPVPTHAHTHACQACCSNVLKYSDYYAADVSFKFSILHPGFANRHVPFNQLVSSLPKAARDAPAMQAVHGLDVQRHVMPPIQHCSILI